MYAPTPRLMRSRTDTVIAGVAGGLARYFAIDPVFVRLILIALCFSGVGILLYPILWLVMPLEPTGSAAASADHAVFVAQGSPLREPRYDPMSGQPNEPEEIPIENITPGAPTPDGSQRRNQWLGYALLIVGALFLLSTVVGLSGLIAKLLFPAILIGAGVYLLRRGS